MNALYRSIYDTVKQIPAGRVASYGTVALLSGNPRAARVVGWALHINPQPGVIPCHRVVKKDGSLSTAFAFGGVEAHRRLLEAEGVVVGADDRVDMDRYAIRP